MRRTSGRACNPKAECEGRLGQRVTRRPVCVDRLSIGTADPERFDSGSEPAISPFSSLSVRRASPAALALAVSAFGVIEWCPYSAIDNCYAQSEADGPLGRGGNQAAGGFGASESGPDAGAAAPQGAAPHPYSRGNRKPTKSAGREIARQKAKAKRRFLARSA